MLTNTQQLLKTNRRLHSYSFTRSFAFGEASAVVFTPGSQDLGHSCSQYGQENRILHLVHEEHQTSAMHSCGWLCQR